MSTRLKTKASALALAVAASFASQSVTDAAGVETTLYALAVLPAGPSSEPVDGRPTLFHDNTALAAAYNAKGRKIALDVGHLTTYDGAAPAVGWVQSMYVESDGSLWGLCQLNADGQALIDGAKFGYTSPTVRILAVEEGWIVRGFGALALTNNPALEMAANFAAETDDETDEEEVVAEIALDQAAAVTDIVQEVCRQVEAIAEVVIEAPAAESTASLSAEPATEPAAEVVAPLVAIVADAAPETVAFTAFVELQTSLSALTAERDAALIDVNALNTQLATFTATVLTLTTERDAAVSDLAAFNATAATTAVQTAIDDANIAGKAYPFEREMLTSYATTHGLDKLTAYLASRPAKGAGATFTQTPADGVSADVQAYLAKQGLPVAAYVLGRS